MSISLLSRGGWCEGGVRALVFALYGALLCWTVVRWFWPWCGPYLVDPCPLATPLGCKVALIVGALWGTTKAVELEVAAARGAQP